MVIDFDTYKDNLFNESYYEIREANTRYVVVYGSANSGKSVSVHQLQLINLLTADYDILFIRKYAADLKDSCYALLQQQAKRFEIYDQFIWRYSNAVREIENPRTGHKILLKGIDDPDKLKSIVGIKKIVIEEADKLEFEDFLELDRRARGMEGIQIIVIYNPISEKHWIKTTLRNPEHVLNKKTTILKYTYHHNKFCTQEDIDALERLKFISENHYRIYVLGEDGIEDKQKKFAWAFEDAKHVQPARDNPELCQWNPDYLTWLTFDFNVNPMTATVLQHYDDVIRGIECIRLENSNTWEMCRIIKAKYPEAIFKVTGDSTGNNRNTVAQDNITNYQVIAQELGLNMDTQVIVPSRNPPVDENQILVNAVLSNYEVYLSPACQPLIYDLTYVEMNEKKEIIKDRTSDKKYADFLDNFRYFLNVQFDGNFIRRLKSIAA